MSLPRPSAQRFAVFSLAWLVAAFAAPPSARVVVLALVGGVGASSLRDLWRVDVRSILDARGWLLGAAIGVAAASLTGPAYRLGVTLVPALRPTVQGLYAQLGLAGHPLALVPFFAVIVLEELLWRSAAFHLGPASKPWVAALLATLAYALAQAGLASPVVVLVALVCGLGWTALRVLTRGLAAPLACHAVWNLAVFVLFPLERLTP